MSTITTKPSWRVSSKSSGTNCIEVGQDVLMVLVRDTKNRSAGSLSFHASPWKNFIEAIQKDRITFV